MSYCVFFVFENAGVQQVFCCVCLRLVASFSELSILDCPFGFLLHLFLIFLQNSSMSTQNEVNNGGL